MIQSRSTAKIRKGGRSQDSTCRKLGVFFDGSWNELDYKCDFGDYKTSATCETNIAAHWRLADEVDEAEQLSHYEPGVASSGAPNDDGNFGIGTKQHMLNVYKWLSDNYESCGNKIYVFGFSRGALSARMLQGMIHRVGLAKPGHVSTAAQKKQFNSSCDSACAEAFKSSDNVWQGVSIEFMGLYETVLRTLLHPTVHSNLTSFHMQLTSTVLRLSHALSLGEHRETFEVAELYVDPATDAKQVWFLGEHSDIGGGWPDTGVAPIAGGWMADQAVEAGFLFPAGWKDRDSMAINYLGDVFTERGLGPAGTVLGVHLELTMQLALVRNPMRCRNHSGHPFQDQPVLVHQSVADRMADNPGWVPLPYCCGSSEEFQDSISYVTNDHYEARKAGASGGDPWLKITFGWLRDADPTYWIGDMEFLDPEYYVKATSWTDEVPLPSGSAISDYEGCCTVVQGWPAHHASTYNTGSWSLHYKAQQHFDTYLVLPNESTVANKIIVEVHEDDTFHDDYIGRVEIQLSANDIGQMQSYTLSHLGGTLEVKVEGISSDNAVKPLLPGSGPAQCRWLLKQTGMDLSTVCNPTVAWFGAPNSLNLGSAQSCDGFIEDIKTGAL